MKKFLLNLYSLVLSILLFPFILCIWIGSWALVGFHLLIPKAVRVMKDDEVWKISKKVEIFYNSMIDVIDKS